MILTPATSKRHRFVRLAAGAVSISLLLAACSSDKKSSSGLSGTINGSGSSFQLTLEQNASKAFMDANSGTTIAYDGVGSGAGKTALANKTVDFAGTDSLVKPEEQAGFKGAALLYFPIAAAPITVAYNLKGVTKLQLSPDTIAGIFQATITQWDDDAIKADNPGVTLPSTKIVVAHRSDGSGTTSNFTKFLVAAAPSWKLDKGDTVNWPAGEQAGAKNSGVAQIVAQNDGGIGYVDFADALASKLQLASVKNAKGEFVAPSLDGAAKAVAGATVADGSDPAAPALTYSPINADAAGAYPITAPTWILVYAKQSDATKGKLIKAYINYLLTDGQTLAPTVNYAALPADLVSKAIAQLDKLQIG